MAHSCLGLDLMTADIRQYFLFVFSWELVECETLESADALRLSSFHGIIGA